jgi:hypothetical protein
MKRKMVAWLFLGLLLFAWADDLIAAETDTPDDDIAAAADNDYRVYKTASSELRATRHAPGLHCPSISTTARIGLVVDRAGLLTAPAPCLTPPDLLYSFMSLQR